MEVRYQNLQMLYFFVLDAFAAEEEDVVFLPPLSSLDVVFAELADVTSVLPGVLLAPGVEEATYAEATEDPDPEPEALTEAEPPPLDEATVCSVVCVLLVFQYSSSFDSTSLTFL